jgi:hypothetical protein
MFWSQVEVDGQGLRRLLQAHRVQRSRLAEEGNDQGEGVNVMLVSKSTTILGNCIPRLQVVEDYRHDEEAEEGRSS